MYSVFIFEVHDFIELTKPIISNVEDQQYYIPYPALDDFYNWVLPYILVEQYGLPIVNFNRNENLSYQNIYVGIEPQLSRLFSTVIAPEELRLLSYDGVLKYVFNGKQLFLLTCSQV